MNKYLLPLLLSNLIYSTDYYVSPNGNDDNPGTLLSPFKTIQKAADTLENGDIVNIMGGIYHEIVVLDNVDGSEGMPIVFRPYDFERVVMDGTVSTESVWTVHSGDIWKTTLDYDVWQLFVDRNEQVMARWPNARFDDGSIWDKENHWAHGTMDQSQDPAYENGTLIDDPHGDVDLAASGINIENAIAILNVGSFKTWTRRVNTHSGNTFTYDPVPSNGWKVKHHDYFLEGKLEFLDSEGEWFFDVSTKILYFWPPFGQDPNTLAIRGKVQSYAFTIENSDYVEIHDIEFFGTTYYFDNCDYSVVDGCNLWYPSCYKRMLGVTDTQPEMSVFRSSSYCTVSNSAFRYTDGSALEMYSGDNTIENCYFYHIDYSVTDLNGLMTTIQMGGANNIIQRNTMHKLGASATINPGDAGLITRNDIFDTGHMQGDGAMVQVMTGQAPGTDISYNWLHNSVKYGARFDGNGAGNNGLMHHNVMWGLENSGIMAKGYEFKIFNNTVIDGPDNKNDILVMIDQGGNEGTITQNNVADRISGHRSGSYEDYPVPGIYSNNMNGYEIGRSVRDMLIDPDNLNFRPHPDSALVDAGLIIDGITDGYVGTAPDIGAYEYGGEYWIPGITWNVSDTFEDEFIDPPAIEFNQDTVKWVRTFPEVDEIRSVSPTDDGGSIMISTYTDENSDRFMWLTKLDAYGSTEWTNNLGIYDPVTQSYTWEGYDVIQTSDGGYALIGSWLNGSSVERNNIHFIKTDSEGNQEYRTGWGSSFNESIGKSIIQAYDGGYVIAAEQEGNEIVVFKIDNTFNDCITVFNDCNNDGGNNEERWAHMFSYSSGSVVVEQVIQTPDSGYAVVGSNMWAGNNHQGIIIKINKTGSVDWNRTYSTAGYRTVFYGIDNTLDGGFIVSGHERTSSGNFPYDESLFMKLDGEGNVIWEKTFDTNHNDWPINIKTTTDGGYVSAVNYYGPMEGTMYSSDVRLIKLDTDGNLEWSYDYEDDFDTDLFAYSITEAADLNYIITGRRQADNNSHIGWAMKIGRDDIIIQNPNDPLSDDYSLNFNGNGDYTHLDWSEQLNEYTVSIWVKPNVINQNQFRAYFNTYDNTNFGFQLDCNGSNQYRFHSASHNVTIAPMSTGWSHIAIVSDGQNTLFYFNGDSVTSRNWKVNSWSQIELGRNRNVDSPGNYKVDNVTIWDRALSEYELHSVMNGIIDNNDNGLSVWWDMATGTGNTLYDKSGNNHHATLYGATWDEDVPVMINSIPTVVDQLVTVPEDNILDVSFNGSDADDDMLVYDITQDPLYGSVEMVIDTGFTYVPYNNFHGEDSFSYVASDGFEQSSIATVTIEVTEVNDKPHAFGDQHMGAEDDTLYAQLHAEDGDYFPTQQDMQDITYSITSSVFHGNLMVNDTSGEFMYMPHDNFFGADSFYFVVTDNGTTNGVDDFLSDTAMVHLFVEPVNDAPVLSEFADTSMVEDSSLVLSVFASDIDNSDLSVSAYSSEEAVMAYVEDTLLYIYAEENWNGSAEIIVVANDNMSRATDMEQFMLTVTPVNDAPFFTMEDFSASGDITEGVDTWAHAQDIDSDIFFFLEGAPSWLMMDGSRMVGQPDQDSVYVFTLSVSDSEYVVSASFELTIVDHRPHIISLTDVPQDQGRQMKLHWEPGHMDQAGYFTQFSIWREVPTDTAVLWDFITTVPWIGGEEDYSRIVPTLGDSTVDTTYYSTFRVTAHTEDVDFYHDSEPVTGYSIDNLHPSMPQGLMAVQNGPSVILQWLSAEDEDFNYHNVYRNNLDSVDPAMVFTTSDSFYVDLDMAAGSWEYWITSVDSAGNESDASESVSVLLANEEEIAIPTVYALEQNYPNPFNPSTQIRYALPEDAMVTISIYDMMGRKVRTLVNQSMAPGYHTTLWNATNDNGIAVSAGMYIYTIQAGSYHHMKKMVLLK